IEITLLIEGGISDWATIAVDVSSSWKRFPRYGFISKYGYMDSTGTDNVVSNLNRFHINGLQFYDWHHKHHMPLKGTPENPASSWKDIANRTNYLVTVEEYIAAAKRYNMKSMAYNLLYGAWSNADADGVSSTWRLFRDQARQEPWMLDFPDSWAADIYMVDPSNPDWQEYLFEKTLHVFQALDFDGWHVDQLGNWGTMYDYAGQLVDIGGAFEPFLVNAKSFLNVDLVMNAVNQYGQSGIAKSPVELLYTEVWEPHNSYADLVGIINDNLEFSDGTLNTILAAYMNYEQSGSPGVFNTPGVLFTDAVIFAAGGAHLELGEHMLGHEYFPNENLAMNEELVSSLIHYYDFLVAYENLLRDSLVVSNINVSSNDDTELAGWPKLGAIWAFSKCKGSRQVFHLINFCDAATLGWRDNTGAQPAPRVMTNVSLKFSDNRELTALWVASPDTLGGLPVTLPFIQEDGKISFVLPSIKYWSMVVAEYGESTNSIQHQGNNLPEDIMLGQNYPNPFNLSTIIPYKTEEPGPARMQIHDMLGRQIYDDQALALPGINRFEFNGSHLSSGTYFYSLKIQYATATRKMMLVK
ncbi:MAG: T9SS type A sorting domain-containing protein, partial [Candidatus Marinimicrobia bacterium]|nr:T9SS type A sorting domain-containing protein [Candidatus Neomarinimicrobiota bacterium]